MISERDLAEVIQESSNRYIVTLQEKVGGQKSKKGGYYSSGRSYYITIPREFVKKLKLKKGDKLLLTLDEERNQIIVSKYEEIKEILREALEKILGVDSFAY